MLALIFRVGKERYALDAGDLVEVLPRVACRRLEHAPAHVAGVMLLRGAPTPVIDLVELFAGRPAIDELASRIMIVKYGTGRALGLVAEHVTEVADLDESRAAPAGVALPDAPYLGKLL